MMGGFSVHADEKSPQRTVTVVGQGRISAAPNVATINVGIVARASTAREALSTNNDRMASLQQVVKDRGIPAKDIQTSQFVVQPQYSQPPVQAPASPLGFPPRQQSDNYVSKLIGYQVQNHVRITARDVTKLGPLLDAVVAGGANQVYGVDLRTDDDSLLYEARKRAMADAKKKADVLAGEAGMVIGLPISMQEAYPYAVSAPAAPTGIGYGLAAPTSSVPISAGEQETTVSISVVYELKSPK